jgi:CheY-like chemotaxis protein
MDQTLRVSAGTVRGRHRIPAIYRRLADLVPRGRCSEAISRSSDYSHFIGCDLELRDVVAADHRVRGTRISPTSSARARWRAGWGSTSDTAGLRDRCANQAAGVHAGTRSLRLRCLPFRTGFLLAGMRPAGPRADPDCMLRCLIVDDNPRFLDAARALLEREGVAVVGVASTVTEAIRRIAELRPDVTLVDLDLGAESGFDAASGIHDQANDATSPVILISTYDEQDYAELIAASPALGFLAKSALSANAVRDLLQRPGESGRRRAVTEPPCI